MRKVIQITGAGVDNVSGTQCNHMLHALCDDGTVWMIRNVDDEWWPIPAIPQATPAAAPERDGGL